MERTLERHFLETGGSENTSKIFYEVGKRKRIKKILKRDWTKSNDYIEAIFLLAKYSSNQEWQVVIQTVNTRSPTREILKSEAKTKTKKPNNENIEERAKA